MKTFLTILIIIVSTGSAFCQWVQQSSPTQRDLLDVKFFENRSVIVGDSVILTSTDSGETWSSQYYNGYYIKCAFQSKDTVWAIGFTYPPMKNAIIKSTDGGFNWENISISDSNGIQGYCESIFFSDKMHGWIGGGVTIHDTGYIFRTIDGGQTWERTDIDSSDICALSFLDTLNGWACSLVKNIYKTTDGGKSWELNTAVDFDLRDLFFSTKDSGWAVGGIAGQQVIAKTADGGANWDVNEKGGSDLRKVWFTDSQNGWAVGGYSLDILHTTNGGINWSSQLNSLSGITSIFESIYMFDSNNGFVVADSGIILKTTNGGLLTAVNTAPVLPDKIELYQNYPNPFNPSTKISYNLPERSFIFLKIYDNLGREIKTIVNKDQYAGFHTVTFDGKNLPSGIYYYKLQAGDFSQTKKLILLK
ncbi:MAG: YCF48-related protein [Ignavibacteriaceae bacterium]